MMNYIYTLIPIALLIFAAVQGSKWNFNAATYMDKKYTNAVKGMMCVVIIPMIICSAWILSVTEYQAKKYGRHICVGKSRKCTLKLQVWVCLKFWG